MKLKNIICVTVDTDPDELNNQERNRSALNFAGLEYLIQRCSCLATRIFDHEVCFTWFIRIDGQIEERLGSPLFLVDKFAEFWTKAKDHGGEIGWHPHLYGRSDVADGPPVILDSQAACAEILRLWPFVRRLPFGVQAFRNGEAWLTPEMLNVVEKLGLLVDSSCIPGRAGVPGHPMQWARAPNHPYHPSHTDCSVAGQPRAILEIPMTSWMLQAPYDQQSRLRYINPAVHAALFGRALDGYLASFPPSAEVLRVWCLIFHPDETMPCAAANPLIAHQWDTVVDNLTLLASKLEDRGEDWCFKTISTAATIWMGA